MLWRTGEIPEPPKEHEAYCRARLRKSHLRVDIGHLEIAHEDSATLWRERGRSECENRGRSEHDVQGNHDSEHDSVGVDRFAPKQALKAFEPRRFVLARTKRDRVIRVHYCVSGCRGRTPETLA